jgi:hypothetical protein
MSTLKIEKLYKKITELRLKQQVISDPFIIYRQSMVQEVHFNSWKKKHSRNQFEIKHY